MQLNQRLKTPLGPSAGIACLTSARLRRPTRLLTVTPTHTWTRYLQRLRWLFGGR